MPGMRRGEPEPVPLQLAHPVLSRSVDLNHRPESQANRYPGGCLLRGVSGGSCLPAASAIWHKGHRGIAGFLQKAWSGWHLPATLLA